MKPPNRYCQSFDQSEYDKRNPMKVVVVKPAMQDIYCVKCRRKVFTECVYKRLKNGRYAVVSVHHSCGTMMYKFCKVIE